MPEKFYYKIGEACKALDIQPYVLRYWETEFKALSPSKSKSGQRVYNERDLQLIQRIKELLYDEGYTIAGAKKKLEGEQASGRKLKPVSKTRSKPEPKAEMKAKPRAEPRKKVEPPRKAAPTARKAPPKKLARPAAGVAEAAATARLSAMTRAVRKALSEARELQKLLDSSG